MKKSAKNLAIIFFLGISSGLPIALILSTLKALLLDKGFDLKTIGFFSLVSLTYTFACTFEGPTATPLPTATPDYSNLPPPAPQPTPFPTVAPFPTAVPTPTPVFLSIIPVSTPIVPTREVANVSTFDLIIYFDGNHNAIYDAGEGISGLTAELYDNALRTLLSRGLTGPDGNVRLSGSAFGQYELRVPYLGLRRVLPANPGPLWIRVDSPGLPLRIP